MTLVLVAAGTLVAAGVQATGGIGFTTGVLTTSTGVNGPPVALWLSSRGLRAGAVRDSLGALFLGLGIIAALTLLPVLHEAHLGAWTLVAAAGSVLIGHAIGSRL